MRILAAVPGHRRWALALASTAGAAALVAAAVPAASAAPVVARMVKATSPASGSATYQGRLGHSARVAHSAGRVSGLHKVSSRLAAKDRLVPFRSPGGIDPAKRSSGAQAPSARAGAVVSGAATVTASGPAAVLHKFNGVSSLDSSSLNGFSDTPPDQGLCVGRDATLPGSPKAVWELVNSAARETSVNGTPLFPDITLNTLFQDQFATGDIRCLYDSATHTFFFTEVGFPAGGPNSSLTNTTVDVTVLNANGAAFYQFDTSLDSNFQSGSCLGDQPKVGFNNNALVVSTDQFCGATLSDYQGALVLAISKPQLVAEAATVNDAAFGPVALGNVPITGADPAIATGSGTGYLVNSFPYDEFGNNNAVADTLGLWKLRHTSFVTTGTGATPTLSGRIIPSIPYAFPVNAASTGDGSVTNGITSEAFLNPDDSRLNGPLAVTRTSSGSTQLWGALDTAISIGGDPSARDGAAWFRINPATNRVTGAGYSAARGKYLLYPAIQPRHDGAAALVFTITSSSVNPSAAFTTVSSATIKTVAAGAGPHLSFSPVLFNESRWGDYSFAVPDPSGKGVWMATEYIPPPASQDPADNWGTFVFELSGT